MVDHDALAHVLDEFAATVTGEFSVDDILRQLVRSAARVLDVDGAGVMAPVGDAGLQRYVAALGPGVEQMERLQEELQDGPCRDAHVGARVISVADLSQEGDWPTYQTRAVQLGLHSVTAVPLRSRGQAWGVLDLYRRDGVRLDDAELQAARTLANLATSYVVVTADRDLARQAQTQLAYRAMHDPLTGLPVRWVLLEQLDHALARMRRRPSTLGVLFLDLDGLKYVNDTYGHAAGDRLITACVERVRAALRPADIVARVGGDEFVVLLEDLGGAGAAVRVAQRVLDELAAPYRPDGDTIQPSASIGIVVTDDPDSKGDTLVSHADAAMYGAKHAGRGRYEMFDPTSYREELEGLAVRRQLTSALRRAVREQQLTLHYQPIVDLRDPGAYAVEALLRWERPDGSLLTAGEFVDVAERDGLLVQIGAQGLRAACAQLAAWDAELGDRAPRRLFVNLSVLELVSPGLSRLVLDCASDAGIAPARLTLEITETGLLTEPELVSGVVEELCRAGCELAIDDFGTGWSSLSRLVQIPASVLKVDRSFTRDLHTSAEAKAVVQTVLTLGRSLSRTVVVEGVEDGATLEVLRGLGCTHVQGHHLGAPLPAPAMTERLRGARGLSS